MLSDKLAGLIEQQADRLTSNCALVNSQGSVAIF